RVVPARIRIDSPKGEVLLLERTSATEWEGLARPTRRVQPGRTHRGVELLKHLGGGRWRVRLAVEPHGDTPLPPYITAPLDEPERHQTVYADDAGSDAEPPAALQSTAHM